MFVNISYWLQHIQAGPDIHILFSVNPETTPLFILCRKSLSRLATSSMVEDHAQGAVSETAFRHKGMIILQTLALFKGGGDVLQYFNCETEGTFLRN